MTAAFGKRVRDRRLKRGLGLREFARELGISATYLSKIERGDFPPPAEAKIVAMADALGEDRDVLLALAGRVASDLTSIVRRHPRQFAQLLRVAQNLSPDRIARLAELATREALAADDPGRP